MASPHFRADRSTALHRPELGTKRTCQHCGARFYDLSREPIVCPKCAHEHTAEMFNRMRRARPAAEAAARSGPKREVDEDVVVADGDDVELEGEDAVEEEEAEFEDASELGEDEEDMAEVIDTLDEAEPDEDVR